MPGISSAIARIFLAILGAISLAIGVRFGYSSYLTEQALQKCIAGGPCSSNINSLTLQSAFETARAEVLLGIALGVTGVLVMMYSFLFAGRSGRQRPVQN
jgi:hypothetical protein